MKINFHNHKRESITIFFCDIYGTVDGGFTDDDIQKFANLLKELKEQNNSDYLFFGMSSTEKPEIVDIYEKQLSKYFDNNVVVLKKFHNTEALREAKISCALYFIKEIKKKYHIDGIYCADDIVILQEMFKETLKEMEGINLNTIIPKKGENNLAFINQEIEERFITKKFKHR